MWIQWFFLFWHYMVTLIRGDFGNVIVRRLCMLLDFTHYIQNVGRQCFGILVLDFYSEFM